MTLYKLIPHCIGVLCVMSVTESKGVLKCSILVGHHLVRSESLLSSLKVLIVFASFLFGDSGGFDRMMKVNCV